MSRFGPALGGSRLQTYTQAEMSKDLQVYHLTNKHHKDQLYNGIPDNFIPSIQHQNDPSMAYNKNMKNIYMNNMDSSLNEYKKKMQRNKSEADEFNKQYKQNVNGIVLRMEREDERRLNLINECLKRQEERNKRFVNAEQIKNDKIDKLIQRNEFTNLVKQSKLHFIQQKSAQRDQSTFYQQQQDSQANRMGKSYLEDRNIRNSSSSLYSPNYYEHSNEEKQHMPIRQQLYCSQKQQGNSFKQEKYSMLNNERGHKKVFRVHNPITNPIEYHIDNPYFIAKMQRG